MEERLIGIEKDVEHLKEVAMKHDERISKHGREIDSVQSQQGKQQNDLDMIKREIQYSNTMIQRTEQTIEKIDKKLDKMKEERDNDHYIKPLDDHKKITWQVVTYIITVLLGVLTVALFPNLVR